MEQFILVDFFSESFIKGNNFLPRYLALSIQPSLPVWISGNFQKRVEQGFLDF